MNHIWFGAGLAAVVALAGCDDDSPSLAELQSACGAGSEAACSEASALERRIELSQQQLWTHPSAATPGCQQGFEGELTCVPQ